MIRHVVALHHMLHGRTPDCFWRRHFYSIAVVPKFFQVTTHFSKHEYSRPTELYIHFEVLRKKCSEDDFSDERFGICAIQGAA